MDDLGEPLASGRAADVYRLGTDRVLRRYRTDHDVTAEGELMRHLRSSGYPVPVVHSTAGRDLTMDLIPGPTMLEDIERRPWRMISHLKTLSMLQMQLAAIVAPTWLPHSEGVPIGSSVLHLDLHPMNVILGPDGPVVIDWTNAQRGHADFDAAMTVVLAASFEPTNGTERIGQQLMLWSFVRHRGAESVDRWWTEAVDWRRADPNLTPGEDANLEQMRDRRPRPSLRPSLRSGRT